MLNVKTVLFLTFQFSVSHLFAHSLNIKQFYLTPVQSGPGTNDNEGVLHITQSSKTEASPSDCLESYLGHSLELRRGLPLSRDALGVFCSSIRQECCLIYHTKARFQYAS